MTTKKKSSRRSRRSRHGNAVRQRKTRDIYVVQGNYGYGHGWEDVTAEDSLKQIRERLKEYRENEPGIPFRTITRRERIAPPAS